MVEKSELAVLLSEPDALAPVFGRSEATRARISASAVRWRLRTGAWVVLRRGQFCRREVWEAADVRGRHLLEARAAQRANRGGTVVLSHLTAAVAWDLPTPAGDRWPVWLTDPAVRETSTRYRERLVVEVAPLPAADRTTRRGLDVTSAPRTVADCLRHLPPADALAVADAAIGRRLASGDQVQRVLDRQAGWPYLARAASLVPLVDGRRESWLESAAALAMHAVALPLPEPQVEVLDESGRFVARVDGAWRSRGVVLEIDGAEKYRVQVAALVAAGMAPEEAAAVVLHREKAREDKLRACGLEVVRLSTSKVLGPGPVLQEHVLGAFRRADPARVCCTFRSTPAVGMAVA